ncbi:MAG: insulinase family protein [Candidatus Krumholzibacteria bacterium]|nr:insulinase family protein [Candidatus Krumholzibacteria bacterium]
MASTSLLTPRVKKYKSESGVTILQQNNPTSRAFCIGVWINTGSRDETSGEEGLCHFLEHMMFKGTKSRSAFEISSAIEKVGGSLEAFTTREQICIYALVLDEHKDLAADILHDMILNPTFPPDQIGLERNVVLEEIRDVMDAPDDLIHDLFASHVFPDHPLGKPILGSPQSVASFGRGKLRAFARKNFRPDNIIVAVFGNLDKRRLLRMCDWSFDIPDRPLKRNNKRIGKYRPVKRLFKKDLHHQHICIGARSCSYTDENRYPLMVLTTLLGGTMSSRLFQRIREELGFTYSIFTYTDSARDTGLIGTYMSVSPANTDKVVNEVFNEFAKIRGGAIQGQEVEDTKQYIKGKILLGLEGSASKMMRVARNEIYFGRQISERELIDKIDRVTLQDVVELAQHTLDADRNTIVSLGPSSLSRRPNP